MNKKPFQYSLAISMYDKFDELAILHDIVKKNFKSRIGLFVCSNYPNAYREIENRNLEIDGFVQAPDISVSPSDDKDAKRLGLVLRSVDTVRRSCTLAMENSDYVVHLHCDAWPLSETKLLELFSCVSDGTYDMAVRGLGWNFIAFDRPIGGIDDHFFAFNSSALMQKRFFEFNTLDLHPNRLTIHGILGIQILAKLGMEHVLYYDKFASHCIWPGTPKRMPFFPVKPSLFDEERKFLHVHEASFPFDYGKRLQSYLLETHGLIQGEHILGHIRDYQSNEIIFELNRRLENAEAKAKLVGLDYKKHGQDIVALEDAIGRTRLPKIFINYLYKILKLALKFTLSSFGYQIVKNFNQWPEDYTASLSRFRISTK